MGPIDILGYYTSLATYSNTRGAFEIGTQSALQLEVVNPDPEAVERLTRILRPTKCCSFNDLKEYLS